MASATSANIWTGLVNDGVLRLMLLRHLSSLWLGGEGGGACAQN